MFREQRPLISQEREAALTSASKTVAVIGALDIPFLHRYRIPRARPPYTRRPSTSCRHRGSKGDNPFRDPVRAQTQAALQLSNGADRIYAVAAGSNGGVFKAVAEKEGAMAIGPRRQPVRRCARRHPRQHAQARGYRPAGHHRRHPQGFCQTCRQLRPCRGRGCNCSASMTWRHPAA